MMQDMQGGRNDEQLKKVLDVFELSDETLRGANDTTASKGQAAKASPVVTATVMRG